MGVYDLLRIHQLELSGEMMIFHFQVNSVYDERELEDLLEILERRGANYSHLGSGKYRLTIPTEFPCVPFYNTIKDCPSVTMTDATTVSQRRTVLIDQEG